MNRRRPPKIPARKSNPPTRTSSIQTPNSNINKNNSMSKDHAELRPSVASPSWVSQFCSQKSHQFYCEVPLDYIEDKFNLEGLADQIPYYQTALRTIMGKNPANEELEEGDESVETSAKQLYGLIHARYILTNKGLEQMVEKWEQGQFGTCLRVFCENQNALPIGLSDQPDQNHCMMYCPRCRDVFLPRLVTHRHSDGAHFGTGFPHMLFLVYPHLRPKQPENSFVPTLYGFKIHPDAYDCLERIPSTTTTATI